jgi:hypothetical protein
VLLTFAIATAVGFIHVVHHADYPVAPG